MEDEDYVKLDPSKNPAQTFGILVKKLETISKDTGTSIEKVLDDYIIDLKNYFNEGYKNKVDCIEVKGLDPVIVNNFISYIRKVKLGYKKREQENKRKEKQAAKIELKQIKKQEMETTYNNIVASINEGVESGKQGSEIEILQRVISDINNDESEYNIGKDIKKDILGKLKERLQKATKEETNRRNAEKVMGQIEEIVEREYQEGNVKNKANYLSAIKEAIENKDSNY